MEWFVVKLCMTAAISIADVEHDGSFNHLIQDVHNKYAVAISTNEPIPFKFGERFYGCFDMECQQVWALDKVGDNEYPRRAHICNANTVTVGDKEFTQIRR